ncbi:hypothetical protein FQN49_004090 [Arthroderma sp. PD_2]|nr:hypothetical protein FQN49_004090 [Arthroderma sp. PD_2]
MLGRMMIGKLPQGTTPQDVNNLLKDVALPRVNTTPIDNCVSWVKAAIQELQKKQWAEDFDIDKFMDHTLNEADKWECTMAKTRWYMVESSRLPIWLQLRRRLGTLLYKNRGETQSPRVYRIPFNRIIKLKCHPAEFEAMQYVRQHTTIPVPRVTEVYSFGDRQHLVMELVDGQTLDCAWPDLTAEQRQNVVQEFTAYVEQLRGLIPPKEGAVGSTKLGPGYDHRLGDRHFGPFENIADFHYHVRRGIPIGFWEEAVSHVHNPSKPYTTKYSHADLCPNNVLVNNGKIAAIIDWEFAGWFPEYWEYTKIHYGWRPYRKEFYDAIEQTMTTYPEELKAESVIWTRYSTFHYDDPIPTDLPKWDNEQEAERTEELPED